MRHANVQTTVSRLLALSVFCVSVFLSTQASAQVERFVYEGLSYDSDGSGSLEVNGRAFGNTDTDIDIPQFISRSDIDFNISGEYQYYSVTSIEAGAFFSNDLTSVIIPDNVTTIGESAFAGNLLTSVIIGESVTTIGKRAFDRNNLTEVLIPDSVTEVGRLAFSYNALTSVIIGESVMTIGDRAFAFNDLTSVIIGESVMTIGDRAFAFNDLTSVDFEGNFGTFNLSMYDGNPNLTTITYRVTTRGWPQVFNTGTTDITTTPKTVIVTPSVSADRGGTISPSTAQTVLWGKTQEFDLTAIYGYQVAAVGGSCGGSIVSDGIIPGVSYARFTTNAVTADCSVIVTFERVAPDAPRIDSIVPGNGQAIVTFAQGATYGGGDITNYKYSLDGFNYTALNPADATSPITITGLTNGTEYLISLIAVNARGESIASTSVSVIPGTPVMPTINSIVSGNRQAIVTFKPGANNGSSITNYEYSLDGINYIALDPAVTVSPITITGLTNGTEYFITLRALNVRGAGGASGSASVTAGAPDAPTINAILPGNGQAIISFTPGSDNGSAITNYEYSLDGINYIALDPADATSPITIPGLSNGTEYSITLIAVNARGESVVSNTVYVIAAPTAPDAPTINAILPGNGQAIISFTPGSDNGSAITNYEYSLDGTNYIALDPADATSPITIPGLSNGTEYSITLIAVNAAGESVASGSVSVIPGSIPDAPTIDSITTGDGVVFVTFTPGTDNGSPITGYRYIKDDASATSTILATTGDGPQGIAVDAAGNVYTANADSNNVSKITPDGISTILGATGRSPYGIALDTAGNVYTANYWRDNVSKISPNGTSTMTPSPLATTGDGPQGIALDAAGNVYTANYKSDNVSKITPDGTSTILGTTRRGPQSIALDAAGNVYTANYRACSSYLCGSPSGVSKITPEGISTFTFGTTGSGPRAIAVDAAGNVYTANSFSGNVSKITPNGTSTILGTTGNLPSAIALDAAGNVYTANADFNNVSKITPDGISTIFGTTGSGPIGIALDTAGNVYTANYGSDNVSKITPASIVTYSVNVNSSPITITGLTNGTEYLISLIAVNAAGDSVASAPVAVTPAIPVTPSVPQITNTDYGDGEIYLTVSDSGSSPVTSYNATCTDGTTDYTGTSATSRITVSGLTNGVGYSCSVTATNAAGTSTPSASAPPVMPEYIPTGLPIWLLFEASK